MAQILNDRDKALQAAPYRSITDAVTISGTAGTFLASKNTITILPATITLTATTSGSVYGPNAVYTWTYTTSLAPNTPISVTSGADPKTITINNNDAWLLPPIPPIPPFVTYKCVVTEPLLETSYAYYTVSFTREASDPVVVNLSRSNVLVTCDSNGNPINFDNTNQTITVTRGSALNYNAGSTTPNTFNVSFTAVNLTAVAGTGSGTSWVQPVITAIAQDGATITYTITVYDSATPPAASTYVRTVVYNKVSNGVIGADGENLYPVANYDFTGTLPTGVTFPGTVTNLDSNTTTTIQNSTSNQSLRLTNLSLIPANSYVISMRVKFISGNWEGKVYYSDSYYKAIPQPAIGVWTTINLDMRTLTVGGTAYMTGGNISQLRFDFIIDTASQVSIDYISIGKYGVAEATKSTTLSMYVWAPSTVISATAIITAASQTCTVTTLGTATLEQWKALFNSLTAVPVVGQVITSTATGTLPNGATVTIGLTWSGAFTYTWNTGVITHADTAYPIAYGSTRWTSTAGTAPSTGYVLYQRNIVLSDVGTAVTTSANWNLSTVNTIGYRNDGSIGLQGDSARTAYVVTREVWTNAVAPTSNGLLAPTIAVSISATTETSNVATISAPLPIIVGTKITGTGTTGVISAGDYYVKTVISATQVTLSRDPTRDSPLATTLVLSNASGNFTGTANSWSLTATSTLADGQYMYQSDGILNNSTNIIAWGMPYLSNLKVGNLSALSANLGTVDIFTGGALRSGKTSFNSTAQGFFLGNDGGTPKFKISSAGDAASLAFDTSTGVLTLRGGSYLNSVGTTLLSGATVPDDILNSAAATAAGLLDDQVKIAAAADAAAKIAAANTLVIISSTGTTTGMTVAGNTFTKSGTTTGWNAQAYSKDGYTSGCYLSFVPGQVDKDVIVGLSIYPAADASYTNIAYGWQIAGNGTLAIFESGVAKDILDSNNTIIPVSYTTLDILSIIWDGTTVKYYKNGGAPLRQMPLVSTSTAYYLDSSFNQTNASIRKVQFGPLSSNNYLASGNFSTGVSANTAGSGVNIVNPRYCTFEEASLPPVFATSGSAVHDLTRGLYGTKSIRLLPSSKVYLGTSVTDYNFAITPNKTWIISARVYNTAAGTMPSTVKLGIRTSSTTEYIITLANTTNTFSTTSGANTWGSIWSTLVTINDASSMAIFFLINESTTDSVNFDGLMLEQLVGTNVTPSAFVAPVNYRETFVGDLNATYGASATNLQVGTGNNLCVNSDFTSTANWFLGNATITSVVGVNLNEENTLNGGVGEGTGTLYFYQASAGTTGYSEVQSEPIAVVPGNTYFLSGYSGVRGCSAVVFVYYYNSSNTIIGNSTGTGNNEAFTGYKLLSDYYRHKEKIVPPADTAYLRVDLRKYAPSTAIASTYAFFTRVMFEETSPAATEPGNWCAAGVGKTVTTAISNAASAAATAQNAADDRLSKTGNSIMDGTISLRSDRAIYVGDTTNGLYLGASGIVGVNAGETKFAIDAVGNATFSGNLTGATGEFAGTLRANVLNLETFAGITYERKDPGTYYFTVPAGKTTMRITICGAGGGGGGGASRQYSNPWGRFVRSGGGGGGGGYASQTFGNLVVGATVQVVVGAGGSGGAPYDPGNDDPATITPIGFPGNNGGASVAYYQGTLYITGGGGGGGKGATVGEFTSQYSPGGTSGGSEGVAGGVGSTSYIGANGGRSHYGVGGIGGKPNDNTTTATAGGIGAGGGGGGCNPVNNKIGMYAAGGGNGYALIEFFDPNTVILKTEFDALKANLRTLGVNVT